MEYGVQPFLYLKKRGKKSRRKGSDDWRWMRLYAVVSEEGLQPFLKQRKEERKSRGVL
jgi:hypothetical protein